MPRQLDTETLDGAAKEWAGQFMLPDIFSKINPEIALGGRSWVMQSFFNATFKDEFEYLLPRFKEQLGPAPLAEFDDLAKGMFKPRTDKLLVELLEEKLAIDPDGNHIAGKIGTTQVGGRRVVGKRLSRRGFVKNEYWNIYAGETEERLLEGGGVADELPEGVEGLSVGALNTRISNEVAQLMANAGVDDLDEGTVGGVVEGRSGAQPTDPDTAVTGTLLFTLTLADPAFGAATDAAPGALKTANAIGDDISADATGTLGYCRASSSNAQPTPLDDHFDGEAGLSGADFNFNTLAIVSGATVSMTSWTITVPES